MKYSRVFIESIGYELPPVVITTKELEERLSPVYEALKIPPGQLELLTGITERRWWEADFTLSKGAVAAGKKALERAQLRPTDLDCLIYAGVCREQFEPATACHVAAGLGIKDDAAVYDISNACLGVLNGIVDVANRIELGQIRAGLVVSCETAREINDITITRLLQERDFEVFKKSLATLTGGSGAVAVLLTDGSFHTEPRRRLLGGTTKSAPQYHALCRWGMETLLPAALNQFRQIMATDSMGVLKFGVELGIRTWLTTLERLGWMSEQVDKVICHQVGAWHRDAVLRALGIPPEKDFSTFPYLGNIGTVSLPLTAALAEERGFLQPGDRVTFLGIGSGLNCLMLGLEW